MLYCFFVIEHSRRKILHFNATGHPSAEWVVQQLREAFPEVVPYHYVILDRDSIFDADVIALAERAHAAFPDQPLLGTDIVRDADSGALYVIECNPRGDAWLISSVMGRMIEQANGLDFAAQFGALEIAARTLAEETRRRAA